MALPALYALEECSSFLKTVTPFTHQFYALPRRLVEEGLLATYLETNPLISGFAVSIALGAVFLVAAEVNRNYSQVDRFWSLLPTFYILHFDTWAHLVGAPTKRLNLALLFSTLWSVRLTYNYWRRGGYSIGSEDYRWEVVRQRTSKLAFHLLNWTFISFLQSVLLFGLTTPAYVLLLAGQFEPDVKAIDMVFLAVEIGLIIVEFFADQQQWEYQTAKGEYRESAKVPQGFTQEDLDRGFVTSGLWAHSRHPNLGAEQAIWVIFYQWACYGSRVLYSWTAAGPLCLLLVIQGSTPLTEAISASKYPEYRAYQKAIGVFFPTGLQSFDPSPSKPQVIKTSDLEKKLAKKNK